MESPQERSWAQRICMEAFAERGIPLSEDDSIILIATVFRHALNDWRREYDAASAVQALAFSRRAEAELQDVVKRVVAGVAPQLQSASIGGSATASTGNDDRWRNRFEGLCVGAVLVGLGVLLRSLLH